MLPKIRAIQSWSWWLRRAITGLALAVLPTYFRYRWNGTGHANHSYFFLLVVISVTLAFGARMGLISVALSTFLRSISSNQLALPQQQNE